MNRSPADSATHSASNRQAALADFALLALRTRDLDALLHKACVLVARGLDSPIAKVMEALPGEQQLVLRACVGIPPEIAAPGTILPGGHASAAGFALRMTQPIVSHVATERRFDVGDLVRAIGAKMSVNVPIPLSQGRYGVLEADSRDERPFTAEHVDFLRVYAGLIGAAIESQRSDNRNRHLMRELQHRVKNDLQIIVAFTSLESKTLPGEAQWHMEKLASRIEALRLVHDQLYDRHDGGEVDLQRYLSALSIGRLRLHGIEPGGPVKLTLDIAPNHLNHDQAVAVGIIVNEFITNALKYAFPVGTGEITVTLKSEPGEVLHLAVADNGIGLRADQPQSAGMGRRLIAMIAEQAGARINWSSEAGTRLDVRLPRRAPA